MLKIPKHFYIHTVNLKIIIQGSSFVFIDKIVKKLGYNSSIFLWDFRNLMYKKMDIHE